MNRISQLLAAYQEWNRLAERERQAIESSDWPMLRNCQASIEVLQEKIRNLSISPEFSCPAPSQYNAPDKNEVRSLVAELIEKEELNLRLLDSRRKAAAIRISDLNGASRQLKRIQHRYSVNRLPAWTSFS